MTPTERTVRDLVVPIAVDLGVDVYDIELVGGTLRILLDRADGIDMGSITDATRMISRALDSSDPISSSYTLEVSSPGIERNLRTPAHFEGALGERVKVKALPDVEVDRRFEGTLESFDDPTFTVRTDDGRTVSLSIDQIERVRTQFVDTAAPKPGGRHNKGRGAVKKRGAAAEPAGTDGTETKSTTRSGNDQ